MKIIIAFVVLFISTVSVFADSPLTSTPFNTAYEGSSKVQEALNCNGVISEDLMKFLNSKNNSIALKVAVINAIGWNFEGQGNYVRYNDFLGNKKGKGALKAQNLLCLAYLKAMDNYFDCNDALRIADEALALNPKSYTFNIIHALIKAQVLFDVSWCELWNETNIVRNNKSLTMDMNAEAIRIIFEYMDLYKEECD